MATPLQSLASHEQLASLRMSSSKSLSSPSGGSFRSRSNKSLESSPLTSPAAPASHRRTALGTLSGSSTQRRLSVDRGSPPSRDNDTPPEGPQKRRVMRRWLSRKASTSTSSNADVTLRFSTSIAAADEHNHNSDSTSESNFISKVDATAARSRETSTSSSLSELSRRNSITDTKVLMMHSGLRSASFTAIPGEEMAFTFDQHFEWFQRLGSGSFADVYAVQHKRRPEERYAVKILKKEMASKADRSAYLKEVELANSLPMHANIVGYLRAWQDECILYVQMELCEGGTLREQMEREPLHLCCGDALVWKLVQHVAAALSHIHAARLIHCDIKPDNVLLDAEGNYKVGDLGQATALTAWDEHEGDARYLAEDLLQCNPSPAVDVFSFGLMLLEVKSGMPLPGHGDEWKALRSGEAAPIAQRLQQQQQQQQSKGGKGSKLSKETAAVDPRFHQLIVSMIRPVPNERPTASAIAWRTRSLLSSAAPLCLVTPREPSGPTAEHQAGTRRQGTFKLVKAAIRGIGAFVSSKRLTGAP